jgi:hypothetical protein
MNVGLIGNGYWGSIVESKLINLCDLKFIADSKTNYIKKLTDVDWVFVCSSTESHYHIVKTCLNLNKHVFCEKPFTGDFNKAKELIDLARNKNLNLFIDNIFLKREETKLLNNNFKHIQFIWNKSENINQDIYNSLLYHDVYLLLDTIKNETWKVVKNKVDNYNLNLMLISKNRIASFVYDRSLTYKEKYILLDKTKIDYSKPKTDPLSETIVDLKLGNIDYKYNQELTLKTLKLLKKIRNHVNA